MSEREWSTRKQRIDPLLDAAGWRLPSGALAAGRPHRREEHPTRHGPADYTLLAGGRVLAIVEAKRVSTSPQEALVQAERYARGLPSNPFNFDGLHVPFLYATNGELIWFRDVRHPLNRSRRVAAFHTPAALEELLKQNHDEACAKLVGRPNDNPRLRDYQRAANTAVEAAIRERKRSMLVSMATGTGKTFTMVNQVYRLIKEKLAHRVLFLVDRRALAAQAVRAFASYEPEPGQKFPKLYEVYSNRFQRDDLGDDDSFDPKVMPSSYLTDPKPGAAFVYVCTIQRMAVSVLGRGAIFGLGDETIEEDADRLDIPIHAFDLIIADECHRGYTAAERSVWRETLDHFDAIKIGLTATPAAHTTAYFSHLVYNYDYKQALIGGHLVDYDVVAVKSEVRMTGFFLAEGEDVEVIDPGTGLRKRDTMEDERQYAATEVEEKITAPDSNRRILAELKKYTDTFEQERGRFPKTLIFAMNDLPHTSHAQQLVDLARDLFERGDSFVAKITGGKDVDRPLQRIREFRNRPSPGIVVTVDMLSTGVDIPDLEFIVLLRPVRSRILFEQIIGRGTRKGERLTDKDRFIVVDCFDGTLVRYFRDATNITVEAPVGPSRTIVEIIEDVWANQERDFNIGCLIKRLHRIDRAMAGGAREDFAHFIPEGDLAAYARGLAGRLRTDFVGEMALLRRPDFQRLLTGFKRPPRHFLSAPGVEDVVSSAWLIRDGAGAEYKPEDYLSAFSRFVREQRVEVEAFRVLLDRPAGWSPLVLEELLGKLANHPLRFSVDRLQKAHANRYRRALLDIISMVKHAADEQSPLLTAAERVDRAFLGLEGRHRFSPAERVWLDRIREHLRENLSIDQADFDTVPILSRPGGWGAASAVFGSLLPHLLLELNEGIAA